MASNICSTLLILIFLKVRHNLRQKGKFLIYFSGYARDGGLYFPEKIPCLGKEQIEEWADLSYPDLVKKIMPIFISEDEIPTADLTNIIDNAFKKFTGWF